MAETFSSGDVVRLKSGGPEMTIRVITVSRGEQVAFCQWFDGGKVSGEDFKISMLKRVDVK